MEISTKKISHMRFSFETQFKIFYKYCIGRCSVGSTYSCERSSRCFGRLHDFSFNIPRY